MLVVVICNLSAIAMLVGLIGGIVSGLASSWPAVMAALTFDPYGAGSSADRLARAAARMPSGMEAA